MTRVPLPALPLALLLAAALLGGAARAAAEERDAVPLFGDLHLHTSWSADAYFMGNGTADPDVAYRYAKGLPVVHPYHRARVRIDRPLDFLAVADHAEFLGVVPKLVAGDPLLAETELGRRIAELGEQGRQRQAFGLLAAELQRLSAGSEIHADAIRRASWRALAEAADRHYEPGRFSTLVSWEWTPTPGGAHLHRVVLLRDGGDVARRFLPYTSLESGEPEDLWRWLEETSRATGARFLAIPHNPNLSFGGMFPLVDGAGAPIDADHARRRARWEPLVEVTQIKGDSETHPALSPDDPFADFETYAVPPASAAGGDAPAPDPGSYVRSALLRGLEIAGRTGVDPYRFGLVGSTDSHTGLSSAREDAFHGKFGIDSTPEHKHRVLLPGAVGFDMSAAGLAAVWAEANTREALFDALRRREVYATTGPRIRVHVLGGWDPGPADADADADAGDPAAPGVPMGAALPPPPAPGRAPVLRLRAAMDPEGARLERIQVVKGWLGADGRARERVYDAALSDGRRVGASIAPVAGEDGVDRARGTFDDRSGDPELRAVWRDPDFDADALAFYYVRVLQVPTPRHSLLDALALGLEARDTGRPAAIQERAYTSPLWYAPAD